MVNPRPVLYSEWCLYVEDVMCDLFSKNKKSKLTKSPKIENLNFGDF